MTGDAGEVDVNVAGAEQRDAEAVGDRLEGLLAVGDSAAAGVEGEAGSSSAGRRAQDR